jgi:hypothetical protein
MAATILSLPIFNETKHECLWKNNEEDTKSDVSPHLLDTRSAALAAATTGKGSAVEKMTLRPLLISSSLIAELQATKPPKQPAALLRVPTWTSTWKAASMSSRRFIPIYDVDTLLVQVIALSAGPMEFLLWDYGNIRTVIHLWLRPGIPLKGQCVICDLYSYESAA